MKNNNLIRYIIVAAINQLIDVAILGYDFDNK